MNICLIDTGSFATKEKNERDGHLTIIDIDTYDFNETLTSDIDEAVIESTTDLTPLPAALLFRASARKQLSALTKNFSESPRFFPIGQD